MFDQESNEEIEILIRLPEQPNRMIKLPGTKTQSRYVLLEQVVMMHLSKLFPASMELREHAVFRILRDSEIEIEEEAEDLVLTFETALKRRRRGHVIQLIINNNIGTKIVDFLSTQLRVAPQDITTVKGLVGLADTAKLISAQHQDLLFKPYHARFPERIRDFGGDCFAAIRHKDILVHHPFDSFDVVVHFLRQAARDQDVVAIKQTLYRTSDDSPIVQALIEAAEAGKSVTALVELKARFDEEANIRWARNMERAGVQVVYGFVNLKTHAKVSLVLRREAGKLNSYAHFGTGNYHPVTAKIYTDLSYFTCNKDLCRDTSAMFNYMTGYAKPMQMNAISIAPLNLREKLVEMIDAEIAFAKEKKPASLWFKCNSLVDPQIVDKLYEASQAGVEIELIVRGVCTIRPGIPGFSDNIRVTSVVGRFLEHSRIYCFGNGYAMPSRRAKVFMSSADLMNRNLSRRIEALIPIENKTVHKQILDQIMVAYLKDKKQSWIMGPDGVYIRETYDETSFYAHNYFMHNPSLSGRGKALKDAPMPPPLSLEKKRKKS
jgi:polyphosphate kinase